jgi:hypothetical protein
MADSSQTESPCAVEQQWRAAIVEVERVRSEYIEQLRSTDGGESESGRLWLRLWNAERRRDELFRAMNRNS